jgi:predicted ester cyclase
MSVKENKAVMRRIWKEIWSDGKLDLVPQTHAEDYVFHSFLGNDHRGIDYVKQAVTKHRTFCSDFHAEIESMVGEGDMLAVRVLKHGTITGDLMGKETIGKQVKVLESYLFRFSDGKAKEMWDVYDRLAFFQQMGIAPPGYQIAKK